MGYIESNSRKFIGISSIALKWKQDLPGSTHFVESGKNLWLFPTSCQTCLWLLKHAYLSLITVIYNPDSTRILWVIRPSSRGNVCSNWGSIRYHWWYEWYDTQEGRYIRSRVNSLHQSPRLRSSRRPLLVLIYFSCLLVVGSFTAAVDKERAQRKGWGW